MAFDKREMAQHNLDESDVNLWKQSACMGMFIEKVQFEQRKALDATMKEGVKNHDKNAGLYNAYKKILSIIDDA